MTHMLTRRDFEKAHAAVRRTHEVASKAKEKTAHITGTAVRTLEVGAAALAMGVATVRFNNPKIGTAQFNVPVDLGVGLALHAAAFMNLGGKFDEDLHALGDGALASYLVKTGAGIGGKMLQSAAAAPATAVSGFGRGLPGFRPGTSGAGLAGVRQRPLSAAELFQLSRVSQQAGVHPLSFG